VTEKLERIYLPAQFQSQWLHGALVIFPNGCLGIVTLIVAGFVAVPIHESFKQTEADDSTIGRFGALLQCGA